MYISVVTCCFLTHTRRLNVICSWVLWMLTHQSAGDIRLLHYRIITNQQKIGYCRPLLSYLHIHTNIEEGEGQKMVSAKSEGYVVTGYTT